MKRTAMKPMNAPLAALVSLCSGCPEGAKITFDVTAPAVLDGAVAYLDRGTDDLIVVDPAKRTGRNGGKYVARFDAGEAPVSAAAAPRPDAPDRTQLVIMDPGAEQALLVRDKRGTTDLLKLGVALEGLDISPDGRYAVAYQPEGATPTQSVFAVQNTVAVLDLHPSSPAAKVIQLGSSGVRPHQAVFSGSMRLEEVRASGDGQTTARIETALAFVFVRGGLVPLDLERATAGPFVPLTPDRTSSVFPAEVLFTNNEGDAVRGTLDGVERAFVRTNNGQLFVLSITIAPGDNEILVALENVVTPGTAVRDVELYFDAEGNALLLAAAGNELILVDGYTGVADRLETETYIDSLARFVDPSSSQALALGYSSERRTEVMLRLDPLALDRRRSTGMETLYLASPVRRVQIASGAARALLFYQDARDLGVLDLARDGNLLDLSFAETPAAHNLAPEGDRLWVVSRSAEDDKPHLAEVSLGAALRTQDVRLDKTGPRVGTCGDYVWVDHDTDDGAVTFFPRNDLSREAARAFQGLFYTDLLSVDPDHDKTDASP